jgi:hypothetical protein
MGHELIDLGNTHFTWVTESASFCLVEEDKFTHPIGIRFFSVGGAVFELDLTTQFVEKFLAGGDIGNF